MEEGIAIIAHDTSFEAARVRGGSSGPPKQDAGPEGVSLIDWRPSRARRRSIRAMTLPFGIDFEATATGAKTSEGDGITAAMLEEAAASCGCGAPGGCLQDPVEDPDGAE